MASLSDIIESFIKKMFKEMEEEVLEIQRNELANKFQCAPSQINYVLSTRFTLERGYYVESKRGGGGYVRITRLNIDDDDLIKCILEDIGDSISQSSAMDYIKRLLEKGIITTKEALIIRAAIDRRNLNLNVSDEGALRANILKGIISSILYYQSL
ncbi:MAG TPA: CtsR family transcriptional regulator [Thermoanaerobacterales bacterium]|nr:CtsR family transcriptional regulator [Thermoanaerobacterales bacterium]